MFLFHTFPYIVSSKNLNAQGDISRSTGGMGTYTVGPVKFVFIWRIVCTYTLRPRQNGRHFADDILMCIFLNENVWIPIKISMKFVSKGPINNIPALVRIMAWRRPGDKPLSEPMMVSLTTHISVTWPQWVKDMCEKCAIGFWLLRLLAVLRRRSRRPNSFFRAF